MFPQNFHNTYARPPIFQDCAREWPRCIIGEELISKNANFLSRSSSRAHTRTRYFRADAGRGTLRSLTISGGYM